MPRNARPKAKLTSGDVGTIVTLIETWEGPLTWERLVERVGLVLGRSYSRQALDGHDAIKAAFQARKRRNRAVRDSLRAGKATGEVPADLAAALQRAEAAELRAAALEARLDRYRARFVVWLYNARNFGMTVARLNSDLPKVDQEAGALWGKKRRPKP